MQKIEVTDIISFLKEKNITYNEIGELKADYELASFFNIISRGFYFFKGENIPEGIEDSLLLVSQEFDDSKRKNNSLLKIYEDPQTVFYQLLSSKFGTASTGLISELSVVDKEAKIGKNVQIDPFCVIGKAVIGDNVIIKSNCYIHDNSMIDENVTIEPQSVIGAQGVAWSWNTNQTEKIVQPQLGGVCIGKSCFLGANSIIVRGSVNEFTEIGENTLMAPGCRVGHGTKIGSFVHFANNVITGGNTHIRDFCFVGSASVFRPKVKLHQNTIVGAGAVVVKNTSKQGLTLMGVPAVETETKDNPSGMPKPKK